MRYSVTVIRKQSYWSNWEKKALLLCLNGSFADPEYFGFGSWVIPVKTTEIGKESLYHGKQAGQS